MISTSIPGRLDPPTQIVARSSKIDQDLHGAILDEKFFARIQDQIVENVFYQMTNVCGLSIVRFAWKGDGMLCYVVEENF